MSGAYVAKPATTTPVDVPPGWDDDWPRPGDPGYDPDPFFPAPLPPGYEPDYSFSLFGTESIAYDGTASITGTFRDYSTYVTNEPDAIRWTATVTGSSTRSINLRFSGDEEYSYSISSDCIFGTYWGATPDIEFELEEGDTGGTVVLIGKSAITGSYVGASLAIEISATNLAVVIDFNITGGGWQADVSAWLEDKSYIVPPQGDGNALNLASEVETKVIDMANMVNEITVNPSGVQFAPRRDWDEIIPGELLLRRQEGFWAMNPR